MKVRELVNLFNTLNQEAEVLICYDECGDPDSKYNIVTEHNFDLYGYGYARDKSSGRILVDLLELSPHALNLGYKEEDLLQDTTPCVIIYPGD